MKVFIIGGNQEYIAMFANRGWTIAVDIFDADLIQFTGGADVTPEIYGEKNTHSHNDFKRDLKEAGYFAVAQRLGKPMAGICRGGQFLNVMCGGKMIQHVEGHATGKTHTIYDYDTGKSFNVTSTHHQMMLDADEYGCSIIACADIVGEFDTEVLLYNEQKVLCFQPHPEFPGYKECQDYYFELLERCLGLKA